MRDPGDVSYLLLADRAVPYLLARVRWPDVAQAISAASPDWIEDAGLFDLPYDTGAVRVSFPQAAAVAEGWGQRLQTEVGQNGPSYVRRMPANWSDLSPSEQRTWGIESIWRRRAAARGVGRLRPLGANGDRPALNGHGPANGASDGLANGAAERRAHVRVGLLGRAHIRYEQITLTAGIVDLSERGIRCVLPEGAQPAATGTALEGPFLLEAEVHRSRLCLDVAGRISWQYHNGDGMDFGVALGQLADDETEGVRRLLTLARKKAG
jgi:hypothetical protein